MKNLNLIFGVTLVIVAMIGYSFYANRNNKILSPVTPTSNTNSTTGTYNPGGVSGNNGKPANVIPGDSTVATGTNPTTVNTTQPRAQPGNATTTATTTHSQTGTSTTTLTSTATAPTSTPSSTSNENNIVACTDKTIEEFCSLEAQGQNQTSGRCLTSSGETWVCITP